MNDRRVPVPVTVLMHPDLHSRLRAADPDLSRCQAELAASLARLVTELGLPAAPTVSMAADRDQEYPVAVTVAGSPSWSLRGVATQPLYWAGMAGRSPAVPLAELIDLPDTLMAASDHEMAARTLAAAVTEAVRRDGVLLLTPPVTELWAAKAGLPAGWDPATVLRELVKLGLPPGSGAEVGAELARATAGSVAGLEAVIAVRASAPWELVVSRPTLRKITADAQDHRDRFAQLREWFAADTGLRLPRVVLGGGAAPDHGVLIRLFGVTGPVVLLHPAPAAPAADRPGDEPAQVEFPAACEVIATALAVLAKDRSNALVTISSTARRVDQLGRSLPKLSGLTPAMGLEIVTRLLRALAAEDVNIRSLPLILQAAVDCHERAGSLIDEAELLHQVRVRLGQTITRAVASGADHLDVTRLPGELEDLSSPDATARLRTFAAHLTAGQRGVLVTTPQARAGVCAAVAPGYPTLTVLGEDELSGTPLHAPG